MPGAVAVGVFGKLPARGDFVRLGLPRDFTDAWDAWLSAVIAQTRDVAGEDWLPAFLEAPVWRFSLPAGMCGRGSVLGVMLPSVDRAGRYFPLTAAAVGWDEGLAVDAGADAWLDGCEAAGLAALEQDLPPDAVVAMLGRPGLIPTAKENDGRSASGAAGHLPTRRELQEGSGVAIWWTNGAPRVAAGRLTPPGLPDAAEFAMMLGLVPNPCNRLGTDWEIHPPR